MLILELAIAFFAGIILFLDRGMAHMCYESIYLISIKNIDFHALCVYKYTYE